MEIVDCGATLITLVYNVLMAVVDVGVIVIVRQSRNFTPYVLAPAMAVVLAGLTAVVLGGDRYAMIRLFTYGIFLHGFVVNAMLSWLMWSVARRAACTLALIALLIAGVAIDGFLIEPTWLEVSYHQLRSPKLNERLRLVVIADIQTDRVGEYERRVLKRALAEKPDIIVLAGDYIQIPGKEPRRKLHRQLRELLREINFRAPKGVFAVEGNIDDPKWSEIFSGLPVTVIEQTRSIDLSEDNVRITGLSMLDSFDVQFSVEPSERFHICLGHCPNFALGHVPAELLVAGHTHGGQVRIPLFGPIMTLSQIPRAWADGLSDLGGGRHLLVSRGIGMERSTAPRIRLFCRPELVVLELIPEREEVNQGRRP